MAVKQNLEREIGLRIGFAEWGNELFGRRSANSAKWKEKQDIDNQLPSMEEEETEEESAISIKGDLSLKDQVLVRDQSGATNSQEMVEMESEISENLQSLGPTITNEGWVEVREYPRY